MDHNLAIKNNAAERYLLGELSEAEIEEYEEHYFSCPSCAQEVTLGSEFIDHAREVLKTDFLPEPQKAPVSKSTTWGRFWNSLRQPAPAFACGALFIAIGFNIYQNALVQDLRKPEMFATEALMLRASRGLKEEQVQAQSGQPFRIAFQIPAKGDFRSYIADVLNKAGVKQLSIPITINEAKNTIQIKFRAGGLQPGNYTVVIEGVTSGSGESAAKQEIVRYPFSVNIQDQ